MGSSTWKAAERRLAALFGGVRAPLSGPGSNITAGDVVNGNEEMRERDKPHLCMFPPWLYVEIKRNRTFELHPEMWYAERERAKAGRDFVFDIINPKTSLYEMRMILVNAWLETSTPLPAVPDHSIVVRRRSALFGLFEKSRESAHKEGRTIAMLAFQVHARHGTILAGDRLEMVGVLKHMRRVSEALVSAA